MTAKYRIEIDLLLDERAATWLCTPRSCRSWRRHANSGTLRTRAMELAKDVYRQRGGARTVENGGEREISADEFIDSTEQALLELVERNLVLSGIAIGRENCRQLVPEVESAQ